MFDNSVMRIVIFRVNKHVTLKLIEGKKKNKWGHKICKACRKYLEGRYKPYNAHGLSVPFKIQRLQDYMKKQNLPRFHLKHPILLLSNFCYFK